MNLENKTMSRAARLAWTLALASFCVLSGACHRERSSKSPVPEPTVAGEYVVIPTNSPQLGSLTIERARYVTHGSLPLAGRLMWNEDATVRVFTPFAGKVERILVEVNQAITNGQSLAEVLSGEFGQALAEARKAESDFRRTDRALNRLRDLAQHGAAPQKDLESAEADFQSAQAEKDRAHSRLTMYGANETALGNSFLLPSPLTGVVVERNVTPGQEVRPDQMLANMPQFTAPLFVVTDPTRLWIQIDATEIEVPRFRPGCQFTFTTRAFPEKVFKGIVSMVSEFIDPATRTVKIRGTVENSERLLKAEMFVSVNLPADDAPAATVPSKAVFLNGEKHFVFVQGNPGTFERKEVKIGSEQEGRIPIIAGLQPGEQVVTEGCILLQQVLK